MATLSPTPRPCPAEAPQPNRRNRRNETSGDSYSWTQDDIAAEFGVTPRTVRRWMADGLIHGHRIGPRVLRFSLAEVRRDLLGGAA